MTLPRPWYRRFRINPAIDRFWSLVERTAPRSSSRPSEPTALFVASRAPQAQFLTPWLASARAVRSRSRLAATSGPWHPRMARDPIAVSRILGVPTQSEWKVRRGDWDVVVATEHERYRGRFRIYVTHGLYTGRAYEKGRYDIDGLPPASHGVPFDLFIASSRWHEADLVESRPDLADRVVYVADPQLARRVREAPAKPAGKILAIASTWGPGGLLSRAGKDLVRLVRDAVREGWQPLLFLHPNNFLARWGSSDRKAVAAAARAEGATFARPGDWVSQLAGARLLVTDHTSLSLYAARLGLPVAYLGPPPGHAPVASGPLGELERFAPRIDLRSEGNAELLEAVADRGASPELTARFRAAFPWLERAEADLRVVMDEAWRHPGEPSGATVRRLRERLAAERSG